MAGVQGPPRPWWGTEAMPCWGVQGGKVPTAENKFGYFGNQSVACQCTEIAKNTVFCLEASEPTFHCFLYHANQFLKLQTYNQTAKVTKLNNFLWNTSKSTCA